ncbi:sugar phosphate isomerase/epimerase family protein [Arcticibacterium luteifluviistationis]|uniref:Xylose isomerase n=1 Tax=Arcticibacterium luteifluviistationis TaxID=1784714 RepID=A0A2Z4GGN3_9BACT|nr:sugar phosphate isomerase/epimerase [Arcticibacterium luteifluviistationis]AWW00175.1 xylose isomerase [Arcticibacterium luteifluviistationis]
MNFSRKNFLKTLGVSALGYSSLSFNTLGDKTVVDHKLRVGLASYTLRKYSLDELIDICQRLDIKDVAFKSFHLPYESSDEELRQITAKVKARGLNLYGGGVMYMKTPEDVEKYFNYAKAAGLKMIIAAPNHELLPLVEKKVKETDIVLAIHNHGPEDDVFPSPESVYNKIKHLDKRVGLCIDVGHTFRLNLDPATELKKYKDRLYDVHIKDVNEQIPDGKVLEVGRGKMDIPSIIAALKEIKYDGVLGMEYEKDADHAMIGLAESVGYVRGVIDMV